MARMPGFVVPGYPRYVTLRGNRRLDRGDRPRGRPGFIEIPEQQTSNFPTSECPGPGPSSTN